MNDLTFFVAGTMQGRLRGGAIVDQRYRETIAATIRDAFPSASIICPYEAMVGLFAERRDALLVDLHEVSRVPVALAAEYPRGIADVVTFFDDMTRRASAADVVVAYLASDEPSMGTAVEMWSAHAAGRTVVAITNLRDSLAVLATSDFIVPGLEAFARLLAPDEALVTHLRNRHG